MNRESEFCWSDRPWRLVAKVRGSRKGELDLAYVHGADLRLLIRVCPSVTERRLEEATQMLAQGDFHWVVMCPRKLTNCALPDGVELLDQATLRARAPGLLPSAMAD